MVKQMISSKHAAKCYHRLLFVKLEFFYDYLHCKHRPTASNDITRTYEYDRPTRRMSIALSETNGLVLIIIYFISISKTNDNNQAPEQPIDMRMKKDNKAKA